ncbi:MAG: TonB-dependent receptor [Gemmatimonadaceae bacterium]|nr:TonB-dependent receptor [Chitinophagaceae bacterium]
MKRLYLSALAALILTEDLSAQQSTDSVKVTELKEVFIRAWQKRDISAMPEVQNGFLYTGKKTELINIAATNANISIKTGRQLFAKVPGAFIYDMDGSGNQINISTRGLDPHRSWEYNIRQNGVIINSDMYGYPASHYSAPMESYEKIEMVRGAGSLQYGAQFGGMINFVTKKPDTAKTFSFESVNTAGSFGLLSSYNSISGTIKKFSYSAYYYRRHSDGFRKNSESNAEAQFVELQYHFNESFSVRAELGRTKYLYQIPGPLNDSMFHADPKGSTRKRNFFSPDIFVPSVTIDWKLSPRTQLIIQTSAVFGKRSSVQFDAFATVRDNVDPLSGNYKNRQVDIDGFNSRTIDARASHNYQIGVVKSRLTGGLTYMNNDLHRRQLGKGTTGTDFDLSLVEPGFGRDIHFRTSNVSFFAENAFDIGTKLTVSPGIRFEKGISRMSGEIRYYPANELPAEIKHEFVLAGISVNYKLDKENGLYGGISQAYRPVLFKDIVPASVYEKIDENLEDALGYNAEVGLRGKIAGRLQYDVSYFRLVYKNRMGALVLTDNAGQPYTYKTNVGDSRTNGMELFLQYKFPITNKLYAGIFSSTSYMDAVFTDGQLSTGTENKSIRGNKVESVPHWISRNGVDIVYQGFSCTILYSYTGKSFSDALNTVDPPTTGAKGITPGYGVWDFNASVPVNGFINVRAGVGNIFDLKYFTKRPVMYPGPGIWTSDGRNFYVTVGLKI